MNLSTELRLKIYDFALQDVVDNIVSDAASKRSAHENETHPWPKLSKKEHPIFVGALAFRHINRYLRRKSLDALAPLAAAHIKTFSDQDQALTERIRHVTRTKMNVFLIRQAIEGHILYLHLLELEHKELRYQLLKMRLICRAIRLVP